jgi:hypothetical protein
MQEIKIQVENADEYMQDIVNSLGVATEETYTVITTKTVKETVDEVDDDGNTIQVEKEIEINENEVKTKTFTLKERFEKAMDIIINNARIGR